MSSVRVLIVDDHEGIRKALRRLLTLGDWEVCGEATDGLEAIAAARRLEPDLIVMDVSMPEMTGLAAAEAVLAERPATLIVLLTTPDAQLVEAARRIGVRGTVSKGHGQIVAAVRAILRGEEFHQTEG